MYNYIVYTCACNISIWLPILCLLPNPFEFIPIGKFRIYIMDCRDWVFFFFFFFGCVCVLLQKSVLRLTCFFDFLLCTKNNILYKTIPSTFVVKPELNLAYYSSLQVTTEKRSLSQYMQIPTWREKDGSHEVKVIIAHSIIVQTGLRNCLFTFIQFSRLWFVNITKLLFLNPFSFFGGIIFVLKFCIKLVFLLFFSL